MSKINAVRFINLNYNNNAIRVSDETFQMGGQSTLLSLRNGGGKSVLVQMMTAPFVHKQYRKTKDRPFESYFSTSKPTFILVEWKLDQGAGYCLTGMMVRKNQMSEEQSSEPLEIIQFISEYTGRCEQDIYHIPVVEKSKNEIILKNFNACKQLFEAYKKDSAKQFFWYDMNNYAQSRQYFDKLAEYKIDYREWESIIRKVNLKESGLSELFSDCKNEKELIEKWFLETIQNKLNYNQNRVKEFQNIIDKYIRMYKDNQSKIQRRDTILQFKEDMLSVEEEAREYQIVEQRVNALENRIACFIEVLDQLEEKDRKQHEEWTELDREYENQIARIVYEKLSMEVHQLVDDMEIHAGNRDMITQEKESLEQEIANIEKRVHLYECAKQQMDIDEQEKEYEFLTQRIDVSRANEKELEPERKQIGGYLRKYYSESLENIEQMREAKETQYEDVEQVCMEQEKKENECEESIQRLIAEIASHSVRIEHFDQREDEFNRNYKENFARNILGDYEPGSLDIRKQEYAKQTEELNRNCAKHAKELAQEQENRKTAERKREDIQNKKKDKEFELRILSEKETEYRDQLEERQIIMRYLGLEDTMLWNADAMIQATDRKAMDIDRVRTNLEQEKNALSRECRKLTSGEVLELPQEFQDLLDELGLHPVYGMNWLDRNGYSPEENTKLVRKQPFLPYALILPKNEIRKLERHGKEIYTSFPIPLIPRESLEEVLVEEENSIVNLAGISFYLWFNEKLLNEEELHALIAEKESQIQKKREQIEYKNMEYLEYIEKWSVLKNQTVTKELWQKNQADQEVLQELMQNLEKEFLDTAEELRISLERIDQLQTVIQEEKQRMLEYARRDTDYTTFCKAYEDYQRERKLVEQSRQKKAALQEEKNKAFHLQQQYMEQMKSLEHERQKIVDQQNVIKEKLVRYESYEIQNVVTSNLMPEELEARYDAITTQMSSELQELEALQEKAGKNLVKSKEHLGKMRKKYQLLDREWKELVYDEKEQMHQEILLEDRQKQHKIKEDQWHDEDKQIDVLKSRIQDKKKGMEEQCGCTEPLPKGEIHTVDFDAEQNKLKYARSELAQKRKVLENHIVCLNENQTAFAEYQDLVIIEPVTWDEDISEMDEKTLRNFAGIMRRDYRKEKEEKRKSKDKIETNLNRILRKELYQDDYYSKPLEAMLAVTEQAELVLAQLHTTIQSYDSQMEKLAVDIAMVEKEKKKIEDLLEDYVKDVHGNLGKIDNNSTIMVRERPLKMLRIQLPDWEENEGVYRQRLDDLISEWTRNGIEIYEQNENAIDYLGKCVTTKNLYDMVVGIGNIQIKLYKIEEQREYPITWAEVARNSGGEGFLSAFVILSSLLQYMRRDDTDIFADRNEGKVLLMDNPFAQTNAAHLLKPLMDMASKTNTQLICLSGLGGDSIYGRFDNIYVLNLVSASLRGGMQYLRGEHTRGAEEEVMVSSQIEVMEQQSFLF